VAAVTARIANASFYLARFADRPAADIALLALFTHLHLKQEVAMLTAVPICLFMGYRLLRRRNLAPAGDADAVAQPGVVLRRIKSGAVELLNRVLRHCNRQPSLTLRKQPVPACAGQACQAINIQAM
jgi:hypothetical protein